MDYTNLKQRMEKSIGAYEEKLSEIRAGRANPAILNKIKVDYYGVPTPINQMAGVSVPEARMIVIQTWDMSVLKDIEKAILAFSFLLLIRLFENLIFSNVFLDLSSIIIFSSFIPCSFK